MPVATERQIEAIAYELAERFFKRLGGEHTLDQRDSLSEALAKALKEWMENPRK